MCSEGSWAILPAPTPVVSTLEHDAKARRTNAATVATRPMDRPPPQDYAMPGCDVEWGGTCAALTDDTAVRGSDRGLGGGNHVQALDLARGGRRRVPVVAHPGQDAD